MGIIEICALVKFWSKWLHANLALWVLENKARPRGALPQQIETLCLWDGEPLNTTRSVDGHQVHDHSISRHWGQ
jgi:hypothetical protein